MRQPLKVDVRGAVWDSSGGICFHCGKMLHPFNNFHVDHVVPVVAGGNDDLVNLVASCKKCNLSLGSKGHKRRSGKRPPAPRTSRGVTTEVIRSWVMPDWRDCSAPTGLVDLIGLANWLRVHPKRIVQWLQSGIPAHNVGGVTRPDWRFDRTEVLAWIDAGKPPKHQEQEP